MTNPLSNNRGKMTYAFYQSVLPEFCFTPCLSNSTSAIVVQLLVSDIVKKIHRIKFLHNIKLTYI